MQETFEKYPNLEIAADPLDPVYRIKYMECVKEGGLVRFVKHECKLPKERFEVLVSNMIAAVIFHGE